MKYIFLTISFLLPLSLFAAPGLPHQVYGTVANFTSGTVSAVVSGETVATTTIQSDGKFGYNTLFFVIDTENSLNGKQVEFRINGATAKESITFVPGGLSQVTLSLNVVGGGGGGGSSAPQSSAPAPSGPVKAGVADLNSDGVVDIRDFTYLMVNWGSAQTDLNNDGKVDIIDFTIFMAAWK